VLPVDNTVTIDVPAGAPPASHAAGDTSTGEEGWSLRGEARCVPLEHLDARDIKAVTYSEMTIEETADGWRGRVVLDV
jgi:SHS2 domain-containing protein